MALVAIRAANGQEVESFTASAEEWQRMQLDPPGTYLMPGSRWPAVLKRSIRGLQFFAHSPGFPGARSQPESEDHRAAKLAVVKALRSAGYSAKVEQSGKSSDGEEWQADVLCTAAGKTIAFEVQLSQQTLQEYRRRSRRYADSDIAAIWIVKAPGHFAALSKALFYEAHQSHRAIGDRPVFANRDLPLFPLEIGQEGASDGESMMIAVPSINGVRRMPIAEFAIGTVAGKLSFAREWMWHDNI